MKMRYKKAPKYSGGNERMVVSGGVRWAFALSIAYAVIAVAGGEAFSTKAVQGSTCLHDLENTRAIQFTRGEFAEYVVRSRAVQITKHGVRFIPMVQNLRSGNGMRGWTALDCVQASERTGALCSIPSGSTQYSHVLPCAAGFVPRIAGDGNALPADLEAFLVAVPGEERACSRAGASAGVRVVVPAGQGGVAYDLTQCDFHEGGVTAVYVPQDNRIYLAHGQELSGAWYAVSGVLVVLIVSCITQNIVHLLDGANNRAARGDICFAVGVATVALVVGSMGEPWGERAMLVTEEEVVAYWYLVGYCLVRLAGVMVPAAHRFAIDANGVPSSGGGGRNSIATILAASLQDNYYNMLATLLQLLAVRVHMSMSTPYTPGIALLISVRLFLKIHEPEWTAWSRVVLLGDAGLIQVLLWTGVLPQFGTQYQGYAVMTVLTYTGVVLGGVVNSVRKG
jgi:hypothetical protein